MNKWNILQTLRKISGESQETVASAMGVSVQTVQNWERTMKFRYPEDLHGLLDHYDVDCDMRKAVIWEVYGNGDCPCDVGLKILETS